MKSLTICFATLAAAVCLLIALGAGQTAMAGTSEEGVVNINTAAVEQLQLLPGIGSAKAKAIVEYRAKQPFRTIDELTKVKGIGQKLLAKIRNQVTLQGETTLKTKQTKKRSQH